jgi:hypothetical protein
MMIAFASAGASTILGGLYALVRWAVRQGIRGQINGHISAVEKEVVSVHRSMDALHARFDSHDRRHDHEQRQLIAALDRQGIHPPDGWDTGQMPRGRT